ncbi:hypothetical protein [uncultured Polaribacter sp.]|nr:hypothetical protein [uncultured Polaribacter sp.]
MDFIIGNKFKEVKEAINLETKELDFVVNYKALKNRNVKLVA